MVGRDDSDSCERVAPERKTFLEGGVVSLASTLRSLDPLYL